MDNVCHTLLGVACAHAGVVRRTRFAVATSMVAANLPDLDVVVFATGVPSVAFRRGWTHGVLAQAILPALFAGAMFLVARRFARGPTAAADTAPALGPLLVLSYIGVGSHVFLDYLNNYGVRLLMPFSGEWFYGDALFIVDPWLWMIFGAAAVFGRGGHVRLARVCLLVGSAYIMCMLGSARAARAIVADTWRASEGTAPRAWMVGPTAVNPFRKAIIIDAGDRYHTGTLTWIPTRVMFSNTPTTKNDHHRATAEARLDPTVAGILTWARFPFWDITPVPGGSQVTVRDMRFAGLRRGGFSATVIVKRGAP